MYNNKGFTLIELVVVIVILGVLAITAAPRFLNLQYGARLSTLQGTKGALKSGLDLVYAKAVTQGVETQRDTKSIFELNGEPVRLTFGYPSALSFQLGQHSAWFNIEHDDFIIRRGQGSDPGCGSICGKMVHFQLVHSNVPEQCSFTYIEPYKKGNGDMVAVEITEVESSGC